MSRRNDPPMDETHSHDLIEQMPAKSEVELPMYIVIRDNLVDSIRTGKIANGARLPSERDLAEQSGVARMTARKALEHLESEGLIYRSERKGYFVSPPPVQFNLTSPINLMRQLRQQGHKAENIHLGRQLISATNRYANEFGIVVGSPIIVIHNVVAVNGRRILHEENCLLSEVVPGYLDSPYVSPLWQNLEKDYGLKLERDDISIRVSNISQIAAKQLEASSNSLGIIAFQKNYANSRIVGVDRNFWLSDAVELLVEN